MTDTRLQDSRTRFDVKPDASTHFAWLRTRMALERTLMAWIRTGVSLIAFGFTIFEFLEKFNAMPGVARALRPHAPQHLGLALIGAGVIALGAAAWQYRSLVRYLRSKDFETVGEVASAPTSPILGVTLLLILIGIFAFFAVLLRFP